MTTARRNTLLGAIFALLVMSVLFVYVRTWGVAEETIVRNVEARGGRDAWDDVLTVRYTGRMDVGHDTVVPFVLEQMRPERMRLEFEFGGDTVIQASNGEKGWKVEPFAGFPEPREMTAEEFAEIANFADPRGMLFEHQRRGLRASNLGRETVRGKETQKVKLASSDGAVRLVFVDLETGLESKIETTRVLRGKTYKVETFYSEWRPTPEGLMIPRRQETQTEGDPAVHVLTIESVSVNVPMERARFDPPSGTAP